MPPAALRVLRTNDSRPLVCPQNPWPESPTLPGALASTHPGVFVRGLPSGLPRRSDDWMATIELRQGDPASAGLVPAGQQLTGYRKSSPHRCPALRWACPGGGMDLLLQRNSKSPTKLRVKNNFGVSTVATVARPWGFARPPSGDGSYKSGSCFSRDP